MLSVTGCCLLVSDRDRAVEFYTQQVGLTLARKAPGFAQYRPRAATHVATWELAHFCAETGMPYAPARPLNKVMGAWLLASRAEVDHAYAELRDRGIRFPAPPRLYKWNAYATYFADPDGNLWEVFTWGDGGPTVPDRPPEPDSRPEPSAPPATVSASPSPDETRGPVTVAPVTAMCLLCHDIDAMLPFYTERVGFQVRRREESFVQFWKRFGINLCLWEIGHVVRHIGFEVWPRGDTTSKSACTVRCASRAEVDAIYRDLTAHGITPARAPHAHPWNAYAFYFADPDGNCWEVYHWLEGGPGHDEYQMADRATIDRLVRGHEIAS